MRCIPRLLSLLVLACMLIYMIDISGNGSRHDSDTLSIHDNKLGIAMRCNVLFVRT